MAVRRVEELGGSVLSGPEDIPVGRVAKVADPFGNPLVLLDLFTGTFQTGPTAPLPEWVTLRRAGR